MVVGQNVLRKEGRDKVRGRAQYVDDLVFPGMLYGKTIRSTIPHGIIRDIRFDPAFDWDRIVVVDHRDIPGKNVVALIEDDQPLLAETKVRHVHEAILLLAAEDRELLEQAARHIEITYEELPAVLTMEDALARKQLLYGDNNIFKEFLISKGDIEKGFAAADLVVEETYRTNHQEHIYIETQGMIALPDRNGGVRVIGSLQCPYYVHKALKAILALPDDKITVVQAATGGGFGGKEEYPNVIAGHAVLLARKAGRPVKLVYDRAEDMAVTTKRHPSVIRHKTGVTQDGRMVAAEIDLLLDGGAYCTLSPVVLSRAAIHSLGPYECPNVRIRARVVATNTPPNGAFRGFGAPQACFAYERHMDRIADAVGLSPLDVRRRNMLRSGSQTATGQTLKYSVGSEEVLNAAVEASNFAVLHEQYRQQNGTERRRGIGLAFFFHGAGFTGSGEQIMKSPAGVELSPDGRVRILTGSTEIGQGTLTIFSQIVAEELGLSLDRVELEEPDTAKVPDSGPTVASRTCMVIGRVIQQAARDLKVRLQQFVADKHGQGKVEVRGGHFVAGGKRLMSFHEAAAEYIRTNGPLKVIRHYQMPPGLHWDEERHFGDAYAVYGWACDVVEVEVDTATCEVFVRRVVSAVDVGKAVNPVLVRGQIIGGTLQALGFGVMEEVVMQGGRMVNDRLSNYLLPTFMDAPEMEVVLVEKPYPYGPFGAKGIGELPMDGGGPAVAAAVCNALGIDITELPMTPERLQRAVEQSRRNGR
jgi:CO/xanthine dehydrogenase Mo-binding subunit